MRISVFVSVLFGVGILLTGCAAGERPEGAGWQVAHDTIGDTIVVRTVAGSIWGEPAELVPEVRIGVFDGPEEYVFGAIRGLTVGADGYIYAFDAQAMALHKYSPDGEYVATIGRAGGGPGEYRNPDSGLAVLPDGRIALRDPGNARINLYSPEGESLSSWPVRGGTMLSQPLNVDTAGTVATGILLDLFEPDGRYLGQVHAPEGFSLHPTPILRGDQVWAVVRDEMDVQYITRFRIARGSQY